MNYTMQIEYIKDGQMEKWIVDDTLLSVFERLKSFEKEPSVKVIKAVVIPIDPEL